MDQMGGVGRPSVLGNLLQEAAGAFGNRGTSRRSHMGVGSPAVARAS